MDGAGPPADDTQAARRRLTDLIGGYQASAVIGALARLDVADALAAGPLSGDDLAGSTGADPRALARLLDATLSLGLVTRDEDGRYRLTESGELLRADAEGSLKRLAVVSTEDWRWAAYGRLDHALRTGEPGFVAAHGRRLWDFLAAHPEAAASFTESLERLGAARDQALVATVDLAGADLLVDVGGGSGGLVCAVIEAHPALQAVLFDLPGALEGALEQARALAAAGRCELVAGDFREAVPPGGDVYVLSWILHDWDDATARRILDNCRSVMQEAARLLVVEMVVPEPGEPAAEAFARLVRQTDLEMLAVVGGRERTAREYRALLEESGFALAGITPLPSLPWSVLEATPA
jgi:DNA-binding transcriptional ArsR family regulator/precorrin-6B methylase 2